MGLLSGMLLLLSNPHFISYPSWRYEEMKDQADGNSSATKKTTAITSHRKNTETVGIVGMRGVGSAGLSGLLEVLVGKKVAVARVGGRDRGRGRERCLRSIEGMAMNGMFALELCVGG